MQDLAPAIRVATLIAIVVALLCGCSLSRPAPIKQSYLVQATRIGPPAAKPFDGILRVNRFTMAQSFAGRPMVYRIGEQRFEIDFYNEFLALPATILTEQAVAWLADARLFRAVVPMTSSIDSHLVLEGEVTDFYADFRSAGEPRAVLALRVHLARDPTSQVIYQRTFRHAVSIAGRAPADVVAGFDRAVHEMLRTLESDLLDIAGTPRTAQNDPGSR